MAKAISAKGISRDDIYITDKVWNTSRGYEAVKEACKKSLKKLKTDYIDIYLVHWPAAIKHHKDWEEINADTWRGMEALYKDGLVRNIGVCNFKLHHLEALEKTAEIMPFINQIEIHPGLPQSELIDYCKSKDIVIEAYSPLGNGKILQNETILKIAKTKSVSAAQICLRWAIQKSIIVIPKTVNKERLHSNINVFNFELSDSEMKAIDRIPYCGGIGIDPDEADF